MGRIFLFSFAFTVKKLLLSFLTVFIFFLSTTTVVNAQTKPTEHDTEQYKSTIYQKRFFKPVLTSKLTNDGAKKCALNFEKLCGKPDLPTAKNYISCLQSKFNLIEKTCEDYAHSLIHMNFLATLPEKVSQCQVLIESCRYKNPSSTISQCFDAEKEPPDICIKLTFDFLFFRTLMSNLFGVSFRTNPKNRSY